MIHKTAIIDSKAKVSENVKIVDSKGIMFADNLKLDIKENTLNINSLKNNTVKSKIKYK